MTAWRDALVGMRHVRAGYDGVEVLHDVSLTVPTGQVLALLGPNGAGKTTLLKVLAGLLRPRSGDLVLAGRTMTGADPTALARRGLCLVPEGRAVFPNLTVAENLWLHTTAGISRSDVEARAFELFPVLGARRTQLAGSLSGGQQQMLALARALTTDPVIILLDELSMGLAPLVVGELYDAVAGLAATGVTVVVVEQFVRTVFGVADRAAVLVGGRIVLDGPLGFVGPRLHSAYFSGTPQELT